jgi:hypothetical protein
VGQEAEVTTGEEESVVDLSAIPRGGNRRSGDVESISERRVQSLMTENEHISDEPLKQETPPEEKKETKAETAEPLTNQDQINRTLIDDESNTFVRIKVNGVDQEVSIADMKRDAQKVRAATQKFEEAAKLRREAEELAAKAKAPPAAEPDGNPGKETGEAKTTPPDNVSDAVRKVVETFYSGDEAKATEALTELLTKSGRGHAAATQQVTQEGSVDVDAVAARVLEGIERKTALEDFKSNYKDVWSNPMLATAADKELATSLEAGIPFGEALKSAGETVRKMVKEAAVEMGMAQATPNETPPNETKTERKKRIDNVKSSGDTASTSVAEESPQGVSSVIAEMAKSRGVHRNY